MLNCSVSSRRSTGVWEACVAYLPLPLLLDISLSFWSSLHQLNVTLASTLSQLKCFYSSYRFVWHECAPECALLITHCRRTQGFFLFCFFFNETGCLSYKMPPSSYRANTQLVFTLGVFINLYREILDIVFRSLVHMFIY